MKNMDYGHIGNAEKRYRSIVTEDMVKQIIRKLPFLSNFSMTTACVERLSLALKEYLKSSGRECFDLPKVRLYLLVNYAYM